MVLLLDKRTYYFVRDDHRNIPQATVLSNFGLFYLRPTGEAGLISSQARESMFIAALDEHLDCVVLFV